MFIGFLILFSQITHAEVVTPALLSFVDLLSRDPSVALQLQQKDLTCSNDPAPTSDPLADLMVREQINLPFTGSCATGDIENRVQMTNALRDNFHTYGEKYSSAFIDAGLMSKNSPDHFNSKFREVTPILNAKNRYDSDSIHFQGKDNWVLKVTREEDEFKRCELLKLSLAHAIWTINTTNPIKKVETMKDMFHHENSTDTEKDIYNQDIHRALSAFRFLAAIPKKSFPKSCKVNEYGKDANLQDVFEKRYDFVVSEPHKDVAQGETMRYPLGMAIGMCGRPMNSHYLDHRYDDFPELGTHWGQSWQLIDPKCN